MITRPPGLPYLTVVAAAVAVILLWASYPFWYFEMILFAIPVGGLLAAYWAIRMALAARKVDLTENLGRWLLPAFIAGGVLLALITDAPFWIRFTISQPSMEAYAKTVIEDPKRKRPCQWIGLYHVCGGWQYMDLDTGERIPGSAEFGVQDPFLYDNKGFVWLPSGQPDETADDRYRHLIGHWYGSDGWDSW
ncbi:hypothetical protein [Nonomuraea fuscirosea]|uniref:hypothetical protein n=1 Tax=Nonomuraea fuscirosea TaxID=1291556 RepID=UPI0033FEBA84